MVDNGNIYRHQPFADNVVVAESGLALGNVDPRPKFGPSAFGDAVRSRAALIAGLQLSEDIQTFALEPKGGDGFVDIDKPSDKVHHVDGLQEIGVDGDALITRRKNIGLKLGTADCISLLLHNPEAELLSLIHLGWKGAAARLHEKVLTYALKTYGSEPSQTRAYLGPAVSSKHFIFTHLKGALADDPDWVPFRPEANGKFNVDIPGFVVATLVKFGLEEQNITRSSADTGAPNSPYYSHERHVREGQPAGRNGFVAVAL